MGAIVALGLGVLVVASMGLIQARLEDELLGALPADAPSTFLGTVSPGVPSTVIYEANCGSIGLIGSNAVIPVVIFYNRMMIFRTFLEKGGSQPMSNFENSVAQHTSDADDALNALRPYLSVP